MATRVKSPAFEMARKGLDDHGYAGVGHFAKNQYPDGTPVAYAATIQEFGYPEGNIPPRSFHRTTIAEKKKEWGTIMAKQGAMIVKGKMTIETALTQIGLLAAGQMREKIAEITEPPLKDSTKAARRRRGNGSEKPLVDTRVLMPTLISEYHE